jgi:peptide/nickel transport system substrate-binding protein
MKEKKRVHPAIHDFKVDMDKGRITRREFLRYATLLGMSTAAY